ncbi:MAG: hypothetical protein ACK56I_13600, partial [bacterium]
MTKTRRDDRPGLRDVVPAGRYPPQRPVRGRRSTDHDGTTHAGDPRHDRPALHRDGGRAPRGPGVPPRT